MPIICSLIGHRRSRFEENPYPIIEIKAINLSIEIDFCSRCGYLWGKIVDPKAPIVKKIETISRLEL